MVKAIKKLGKNTYPRFRVFKIRMGTIDKYILEIKQHWYSHWRMITSMEGYPVMFDSKDEAIDYISN